MNEALRAKLLKMADADSRLRSQLVETGELFGGYNSKMAELHQEHAEKLGLIVEEFGWPGTSLVGKEGSCAAWLVLQHAIGSPSLQRRCLPILKEAAQAGEIDPAHVAYLEDRIRVFEGRPQTYGTQFDWNGRGVMSPHPIEDLERVDEYRASVGLGPMSKKTEEIRQQAAAEGHEQPLDFQEYLDSRDAWAREAGWR